MPPTSAIEHIETIQQIWLSAPGEAAGDMANALNDIVHSIFGEPERIGYELLQNADDAATEPGLSVDIEFFLLEKYLVIRHNGAHFSPGNVKALCRYGAPVAEETSAGEKEKQLDLQKIGYKGIGFKSVFNIADRVWVLSDDYTFRFDKYHWNGRAVPWQIVPVFSPKEDLPEIVEDTIDENRVNFVLEIKEALDRKAIRTKLGKLFLNENIILFLRHTRSLELLYEDKNGNIKSYRKLVRSSNNSVFTIDKFENDELKETTRWHVTVFPSPVPAAARDSLAHLDKRQCPEKLKTATEIEIGFAAKLREDNSVIPLATALIFSYLPTAKRYEFPFLVNSNFLMNEARTELLNEAWNEFLFEQIGYFQFHWFRQMADSEHFRYEFAGLLVKYAGDNKERRNQSLNTGAERAQNEIAFVPVLQGAELKKAPETIVDKTRISDGMEEYQLVRDSFEPSVRYEIADPRIKKIERLLSVGAAKFDPQKLRDAIRSGRRFTTIADNVRLLTFFHQKLSEISEPGERSEWMQVLHETPFLLDQDGALKEPGALFFPSGMPELPFELPMDFLHGEVFEQAVANNAALTAWLEILGLMFPRPGAIIRRGVFSLIENEQVSRSNAVVIGRYVFKNQASLTTDDFEKLSRLPLLTSRDNLRQARFCYLPDVFSPKLPLENLLDEDIFVSKNYLEEGEEPGAWNRFLVKTGVRQEMELDLDDRFFPINAEFKSRFGDYWNFLQNHLPAYKKNASHNLHSFLTPLYIKYAAGYDFAVAYWEILLHEKWRELLQKSSLARFVHSGGKSPVPSYFQFLVQTQPYFPAADGRCYPTPEVYTSSLYSLVNGWAPVSYFELRPQQESLLGIRSELSLEDCLSILSAMADNPEQLNKERLSGLYRYMLTQRFQPEDLKAYPLCDENFRLLAVNNTFQPAGQLQFLHLPRFAEKSDSPHFVFLDLADEEAAGFCKLFGLAVVALQDLKLASKPFEGTIENDVFPSDWHSKLPFIATISAAKKGQQYWQEFERLTALSQHISFIPSSVLKLTLVKNDALIYQKDVQAWQEGNDIFYLHDWHDVRTLYDLQEVLAACFDIEGCERELGLLLSIKTEEIPDWLLEQGYALPGSIEPLSPSEIKLKSPLPETAVVKVPVKQAKSVQPTVTAPSKSYYPPIREKDALEIGRWGEAYVRKKEIIEDFYRGLGTEFTEIEWMNEQQESNCAFDFKVSLESGEEHFWEVKSTPSATKAEYPVSGKEFQHALQNEERYFMIRILAAGTAAPDCKILENPVELIREGVIRVSEMKMALRG